MRMIKMSRIMMSGTHQYGQIDDSSAPDTHQLLIACLHEQLPAEFTRYYYYYFWFTSTKPQIM